MDPSIHIAKQLGINSKQIAAAIELLDADNTIPFIARYRKERTAGLDEEQLRSISNQLRSFRILEQRRSTVLRSLQSRDMLTPKLGAALHAADTLAKVEDLYQPHKPKRKTRASIARENGLVPLADLILNQEIIREELSDIAHRYLSSNVQTVDEAWQGARDIVAETISDHSAIRASIRDRSARGAMLASRVKPKGLDPKQVFRLYYEFNIRLDRIRPHQVLAINRAEKEKVLTVTISIPERDWRSVIAEHYKVKRESPFAQQLHLSIEDAAQRLLLPAIERNIRRLLTEVALEHAITVFADNLRGLLLQPPITNHTIIAIDPGFRTGSKVAVVNQNGKVLECTTIYPHPPQKEWGKSIACLETLSKRYHVSLVAIGNGTASRETELLVADMISKNQDIRYLMVSEAGASVYSASRLARSELPDLDVSLRGAVSIARRVIDPLAELVKIDPQAIGVGMYQHDIDQHRLTEVLMGVVESAVNQVGVDINTASEALLSYVSGIGPKLAERIVNYRGEHGSFENRTSILNVPGFGSKTFQQAAGFIRIASGKNPLDGSAIHPESYQAAREIIRLSNYSFDMDMIEKQNCIDALIGQYSIDILAAKLDIGVPTLRDILGQLVEPGRDPRRELPQPLLRSDILKIEDLAIGMVLYGTVRNVVDFGAFIDIGVKNDGLVHRSEIPQGYKLAVGQNLRVEVTNVDLERKRIGLKVSPEL
jgi:uncharacterized protein